METGHAVNLNNFNTLITKCNGFGSSYNPTNTRLTVANMTLQLAAAKTSHLALNTALENSKEPINAREIIFDPLDDIVTRALGSLDSLDEADASARVRKDARTLGDDIRGFNARRPKLPPDTLPTEDFLSQSHQSFVQRTDNFDRFIKLLYEEEKGLIDTAKKCKAYVKSVFKVRSVEFRLVNAIQFRGGRGIANKP